MATDRISDEQIDAVGAQFYGTCYTPADRAFAKAVVALQPDHSGDANKMVLPNIDAFQPKTAEQVADDFLFGMAERTSTMQVVAWATHHEEPMLFPTWKEAFMHCDEDEEPVDLVTKADALAAIKALQDRIARLDSSLECEKRMRKDAEEDAERYRHIRSTTAVPEQMDARIDKEMEKAR